MNQKKINHSQLVILCGIPFSGKSTLAKRLELDLGYVRIDLDEVKFELMGQSVNDENIKQSEWDVIYQKMYKQIRELLNQGKGVIHDTGNFTVYERSLVNKIAKDLNIPFITIFVDSPKEVAKARLVDNRIKKDRFDVTDEAFESAVKEMETPLDSENPIILKTNTSYENLVSILKNKIV